MHVSSGTLLLSSRTLFDRLRASLQSASERRPWSLSEGAGARRLAEVKSRASIQLLLIQVKCPVQ